MPTTKGDMFKEAMAGEEHKRQIFEALEVLDKLFAYSKRFRADALSVLEAYFDPMDTMHLYVVGRLEGFIAAGKRMAR